MVSVVLNSDETQTCALATFEDKLTFLSWMYCMNTSAARSFITGNSSSLFLISAIFVVVVVVVVVLRTGMRCKTQLLFSSSSCWFRHSATTYVIPPHVFHMTDCGSEALIQNHVDLHRGVSERVVTDAPTVGSIRLIKDELNNMILDCDSVQVKVTFDVSLVWVQ
ncbi:hypothetical protein INR49_022027 [Caranx melampygus]|nr:hypothetical protein INR49_022027 [Caranx melampygus]